MEWTCEFKNKKKTITVGERFLLECQGESINLKSPLQIEFLDDKVKSHSLKVLEVKKKDPTSLTLEATSYRTGDFDHPFQISDGETSIPVKNLKFSVSSVLIQGPEQNPYPPIGPFFIRESMTAFYSLFFVGFLIFICLAELTRRFVKRTLFIKEIRKKIRNNKPSEIFIKTLRLISSLENPSIKDLDMAFQDFFESEFLIPCKNKPLKKIMKSFKLFYPRLYKKEASRILQILKSLKPLGKKKKALIKTSLRSKALLLIWSLI